MAKILEKLKEIWESIRENQKLWGFGLYVWLSFLGMLYSRYYYHPFDIDIFNFVEPSDFLLVVFSKINIVLFILLGILLVVVGIALLFRIPVTIIFSIISLAILLSYPLLFLLLTIIFSIISLAILLSYPLLFLLLTIIFSIISLAILLSYPLLFLLLLIRFFAESTKGCILWAYRFMKSGVFLADGNLIDSLRAAWRTFREALVATWRTFKESLGAAWRTFREALVATWRTFREALASVWKTFIDLQHSARKKLTDSLKNTKDLERKVREKYAALFWRYFYGLVSVTLVLGTIYVPHHQGRQEAHDLLNGQQKQYVRVTIRQDAAQSTTRLPDSILFLGTTSSFHFFYDECKNARTTENDAGAQAAQENWWDTLKNWTFGWWKAQRAEKGPNITGNSLKAGKEQTAETASSTEKGTDMAVAPSATETEKPENTKRQNNAPACEKGPFIIPTANIASLEFNPSPEKESTLSEPQNDSPTQTPEKESTLSEPQNDSPTQTPEKESTPPGTLTDPPPKKNGKKDRTNEQPKPKPSPCREIEPTCGEIEPITHFSDARHDELEDLGKEKLENLFCKMTGRFQDYWLQELRLTGQADNRRLVGQALEEYGSNENLATKRAEWVRDELVKKFEDEEQKEVIKRVIPLRAGPQCIDPNTSNCDRALDRSVEVYACWTPKDPEQASPSKAN